MSITPSPPWHRPPLQEPLLPSPQDPIAWSFLGVCPTPSASCPPDLNLRQEVDGLWEGHQAVLVEDQLPQLCAPVRTVGPQEWADRGLPVLAWGSR